MNSKTLEQLENEYWGEPQFDSNLVIRCHQLRKKPLNDFNTGDLRIMIGQSFSLEYLMPLAIEELEKDVLVEGDLYEGDILINTLNKENKKYWRRNKSLWDDLIELIKKNKNRIENRMFSEIEDKIKFIES